MEQEPALIADANELTVPLGMSIRRRRRKKREPVEDATSQDVSGTQLGSPPLPFSPPYYDMKHELTAQSNCTEALKRDSECSEIEPASGWDTTSGTSNALVSNSGLNEHNVRKITNSSNKAKTGIARPEKESSQASAHTKQATSQRSMIDCQKLRFARNFTELQRSY